jgi:MFS transporter, DHA1 family, tetracycline resistance protein
MIGTAWSRGLILGLALGGIFSQIYLETPAFLASVLAILNILLGIFLLPKSLPEEKRDRTHLKTRDYNPILSIFDMIRKPELGLVFIGLLSFQFRIRWHKQYFCDFCN